MTLCQRPWSRSRSCEHSGTAINSSYVVAPCVLTSHPTSPIATTMNGPPDPSRQPSASAAATAAATATTRPLHFVHTDAGSLKPKDASQRSRDVKSHLSGHYRRWKKQQTFSAQTAKGQSQQSGDTPAVSTAALSEASDLLSPSQTSGPSWDSDSSSDGTESPDDTLTQPSPVPPNASAVYSQNALDYGDSDPFASLPLPETALTDRHIQHFYEGTTVMCWTTNAVDPGLRDLLQHKLLAHGVLAISKAIAAIYLPNNSSFSALLPESRQHYVQLLQCMRSYFKGIDPVDRSLAIEMMHAAVMFCFLTREYNEFELHLKSWKSFVDSLGGLEVISKTHTCRFLNADRIRCLFLLRKPLIAVDEWAPGSWAEEDQFRRHDRLYARAATMICLPDPPPLPPGPFQTQTRDLIMSHRDMLTAGSVAVMLYQSKQPGASDINSWLGLRAHELTIRTTEIVGEIVELKKTEPSLTLNLHASACLAVNTVAHLIHFSMNPFVGLTYVPFPNLIRTLKEIASHIRHGSRLQHYQSLYLWALFVGSCTELASRTWSCDPNSRGSTWCSTNLAHMIERLHIDTIEDFKHVLRRFIFPYMFESYLRVLFDKRHELIKLSIEALHLNE